MYNVVNVLTVTENIQILYGWEYQYFLERPNLICHVNIVFALILTIKGNIGISLENIFSCAKLGICLSVYIYNIYIFFSL